jgi:hypothetical protein
MQFYADALSKSAFGSLPTLLPGTAPRPLLFLGTVGLAGKRRSIPTCASSMGSTLARCVVRQIFTTSENPHIDWRCWHTRGLFRRHRQIFLFPACGIRYYVNRETEGTELIMGDTGLFSTSLAITPCTIYYLWERRKRSSCPCFPCYPLCLHQGGYHGGGNPKRLTY